MSRDTHSFSLPDQKDRLYSATDGPSRMTFERAIAYCGGWDAFQAAFANGYIEDVLP